MGFYPRFATRQEPQPRMGRQMLNVGKLWLTSPSPLAGLMLIGGHFPIPGPGASLGTIVKQEDISYQFPRRI